MAVARRVWRWLYPDSDLPARAAERDGVSEAKHPWPARCALRPWSRHRVAALQAGLAGTAAARVLRTPTFELRFSTVGGILDIRRKKWRPGYGMIPSAIAGSLEQAWATAYYIESENPLNAAFTDRTHRLIWTNASVTVALLLQAVYTRDCYGVYEPVSRSMDPRPAGARSTARYLDGLARSPHRVVHAYLQHVYKDGTRGTHLREGWWNEKEVSVSHACLFIIENGRLYHFNPWGAQECDAKTWRNICRYTRRLTYGGDAFHLGHPSCTEAFGHQPQSSEPFCDIWCAALALVLGLNPRRPLLEVMQYFKLKAPTRRYLQAKVFHAAMFLEEARAAHAGGVPGAGGIAENSASVQRASQHMNEVAGDGARMACPAPGPPATGPRTTTTTREKKARRRRPRTRLRSKNLALA